MSQLEGSFDVIVIGAGPSGSVAAALLNKKGYRILVLEKIHFPRFSIGESMLPQCMIYLEQADMLEAVEAANFQHKNGAAFSFRNKYETFDFREKFSEGWGTTFQVQRDRFDKILADEAEKQGVEIYYGHSVTAFEYLDGNVTLSVTTDNDETYKVSARFVLDASGFGRVLPRMLDLNIPSNFDPRTSIFSHVEDHISAQQYDRNKILITVHPEHKDIWYWLIPFSDGRASVGVVAPKEFLLDMPGSAEEKLKEMIAQGGKLGEYLNEATFIQPVREITGYSCKVKQLYGDGFALLGNAGEFLDPVFSSGVTIALKSASLAADVLDRQLLGLSPNWEEEFSVPLQQGVDTFRSFVVGWYNGQFQDVVFSENKSETVTKMISSILAGYAWDRKNPYVNDHSRLSTLAEFCRG